jgi:hypothetical protein
MTGPEDGSSTYKELFQFILHRLVGQYYSVHPCQKCTTRLLLLCLLYQAVFPELITYSTGSVEIFLLTLSGHSTNT